MKALNKVKGIFRVRYLQSQISVNKTIIPPRRFVGNESFCYNNVRMNSNVAAKVVNDDEGDDDADTDADAAKK